MWGPIHRTASFWLVGVSIASLATALALAPWLAARIPADYFAHATRPQRDRAHTGSRVLRGVRLIARNLAGWGLILLGIVLLVLPGQGVLTILLGIAVAEFPGKYRLERWVLSRRPVLRVVNGLRRNRGRAPLVFGGGGSRR